MKSDQAKIDAAAEAIESFTEDHGTQYFDREGLGLDLARHLASMGLLVGCGS